MDVLKSVGAQTPIADILTKTLKGSSKNTTIQQEKAKDFSIQDLLDSLFKDLTTEAKSKEMTAQVLKDKSISLNIKDVATELKTIVEFLENSDLSTKTSKVLDGLLLDIDGFDEKGLQTWIKNSGIFLESKLANLNTSKSLLPDSIQQTLQSLKSIFIEQKSESNIALVDKILEAKIVDKNFINDIKSLIGTTKGTKEPLVETTAKLDTLLQKTQIIESKMAGGIKISNQEISSNMAEIEQVLNGLERDKFQIQEFINNIKTTMDRPQNLKVDISSVGEQLKYIANILKSELSLKLSDAHLHVEVSKLIISLKDDINRAFANRDLVPKQMLWDTQNPREELAKDIKASLLYIKDELSQNLDGVAKDMMPKVDKVLTSINYYQLLSYSVGANVLYLPLLWDGLDEGEVSIKKLKQKRFFCEINLKLKEFGKIDLLVMLFEDIHINLSIFTQSSEFLSRIRENLQLLRRGISSVGLAVSNIYLYDSLKDERVKKDTKEYVNTQQIGVGISLHV